MGAFRHLSGPARKPKWVYPLHSKNSPNERIPLRRVTKLLKYYVWVRYSPSLKIFLFPNIQSYVPKAVAASHDMTSHSVASLKARHL